MLRILLCVCAAALLSAACPALAQTNALPPQEPILRIDAGMHTAASRRVGVDRACTMLATASDDKTVRLWGLPEGKQLRVLRPPIGPGEDGKVYATAVAPDGSWVAAGAANQSLQGDVVYIFQTISGNLVAQFAPLPGSDITHLAVSADGRYLAATFLIGDGGGLRVWERVSAELRSWRLVAEDRDYGGNSYGAAFDRSGVLYTVAYDGKLRRYAPGYQGRPTSVVVRGGGRPYSVAVHPSDDRVAVGFNDTTAVEVYKAPSLAWSFAAETSRATNGNLFAVAWSADGRRLYAGGRYWSGRDNPNFVWDNSGQGQPRELQNSRSTIVMHQLPCGNRIAVGAYDPAFELVNPDGSLQLWRRGVQADLRGQRGDNSTRVAADGRRVHFGLEASGGSPVLFDLDREQLSDVLARPADLAGADTSSLPVTDWVNNRNPRLGGVPIALQPFEEARSLAIAPDRQRFVLGADWSLRGFDGGGKEVWRKQVPDAAWSVNISRDGRLAVAGYGDGTVRWHRLSDGQELLALFVHKVDRRWVAWTPKGYYIASPGAESLIGWHVNGKTWDEEPQFYPADRFRDQFNRPDIVKLVLETLDENQAIDEANKRANVKRAEEDVRKIAPPKVTVQNPGDETRFRSPKVIINFDVFSATGKEITDIEVRVNHAKLRNAEYKPGSRKNKNFTSFEHVLNLQQRDATITVVARDEDDRASEPVSIKLRWDGAKAGQLELPRLRALFVGNNAYPNGRLDFAVKDANDLAAFFKSHEGKSYSKVETKVLTDVKSADVIKGLEWLERESEKGTDTDVNLLFLAGHGVSDAKNHFYYLAIDSKPAELAATAVSKDLILRVIRQRKGEMVVMLDACNSGASSVDMNRTANELGDRTLGVQLYASSQGRQYSLERREWGNGAFTKAMIEGLSGKADKDGLGYVEAGELDAYVRRTVAKMTDGQQTPKSVIAPEMQLVKLK